MSTTDAQAAGAVSEQPSPVEPGSEASSVAAPAAEESVLDVPAKRLQQQRPRGKHLKFLINFVPGLLWFNHTSVIKLQSPTVTYAAKELVLDVPVTDCCSSIFVVDT